MPFAIVGAVIAGVVGAAATAVGGLIAAGTIAGAAFLGATGWAAIGLSFAVGIAGSLLVSAASSLLSSQASPREVPFSAEASARTQMVRSPIASRKIVVGESVVSGALVFASSYGLANGQTPAPGTLNRDDLAMVIVLAAHEISAIGQIWLSDTFSEDPRFGNNATTIPHLGSPGQAADGYLVAQNVGWTGGHVGEGLAYVTVLLHWNQDAFPSGIPNVKAMVQGSLCYDPRDLATLYTNNAALVVRRYLADTDLGLGAEEDELAESTFIAAANACDEIVETPEEGRNVNVPSAGIALYMQGDSLALGRGDRVRFESTGTPPAGLTHGATYYVIPLLRGQPGITWCNQIALAVSFAAARGNSAIVLGDSGTGINSIYRTGQTRYTANGVIDCAKAPGQILDQLMSSMAGVLTWQQGQHRLYAGVASSAVFSLDESDLRGPLKILPRQAKRDLCNAVRGTFIDPAKAWQPSDFAAQENAVYEAEDGGEQIFRDIELPYTTDGIRAQRLAKIALEAMRQGMALQWPSKARALKVCVRDVVSVSLTVAGVAIFTAKEFLVEGWALAEDGGIDLTLREYADEIFDWNSGSATQTDPAPNTRLPNPFHVGDTAIVGFAEELIETRAGAGVAARLTVMWEPVVDAFVSGYELQYRATGAANWTPLPPTSMTSRAIDDLVAGVYEFRLRAVNTIGVHGNWSAIVSREVRGLTAPPADVTGFSVVALQGHAVARWDKHADLDVRVGGRIRLRHSKMTVGAVWAEASDLFPGSGPGDPGGVSGASTEATVPLLTGTYMAKAIDSTGNTSENEAAVVVTRADLITMNVIQTSDEAAGGFTGTKTGCVVSSGSLQIDGGMLVDDFGNIDDIPNWDANSGLATEATYEFSDNPIDLGAVYPFRASVDIATTVFTATDLIDERVGLIDDWGPFDGPQAEAAANVTIEIRTTPDDPAGSPTWSPWTPFLTADFVARGVERRAVLRTSDITVNVAIDELVVTLDVPDRVATDTVTTGTLGDTTVTFSPRFNVAPALPMLSWARTVGDVEDPVSISATGFVFNIRNGGSRVARNVTWLTKGYGEGA